MLEINRRSGKICWIMVLLSVGFLGLTLPVAAQEKPPAQEQANAKDEQKKKEEEKTAQTEERKHTWEMSEVVVTGKKELKEEQLIGDYEQPRWTAERRFPTTRVYVIPEGKFEFERWIELQAPRIGNHDKGRHDEDTNYYEVEMGLPGRFQLDFYQTFVDEGGTRSYGFDNTSIELRWAMAKWGKLWGNPTWYLEYTEINSAPDKNEAKLLLGDELAPRWHWGFNLVREWSITTPTNRVVENEVTGGLSYTLKDSLLSVGVEAKASYEKDFDDNGNLNWYHTFKIGPSVQWKPLPQADFQFAPLVGIGNGSEKYQIWLIAGWEF